jgi:hypothetical protein
VQGGCEGREEKELERVKKGEWWKKDRRVESNHELSPDGGDELSAVLRRSGGCGVASRRMQLGRGSSLAQIKSDENTTIFN